MTDYVKKMIKDFPYNIPPSNTPWKGKFIQGRRQRQKFSAKKERKFFILT